MNRAPADLETPAQFGPEDAGVGPGRILDDKYRLLQHLGSGGMGTVFSAEHVVLGRQVALKFLRSDALNRPRAVKRFEREAQLLARLEHENIVNLLDIGTDGGARDYLVLEFIRGRTLRDEIHRGPLGPGRLANILVQVARGLGAAHQAGVVHRDLKPENVMLTQHADGRLLVKLLDFGVAHLHEGDREALTLTGQALGTAAYMSPEQARGEAEIDGRSDIYALGVIAYECLTGARPYQGNSYNETLFRVLNHKHAPAREQRPDLPAQTDKVLDGALAKQARDRYASAWEFAQALGDVLREADDQLDTAHGTVDGDPEPGFARASTPSASDSFRSRPGVPGVSRSASGTPPTETGPAGVPRSGTVGSRLALLGTALGLVVGGGAMWLARTPSPEPVATEPMPTEPTPVEAAPTPPAPEARAAKAPEREPTGLAAPGQKESPTRTEPPTDVALSATTPSTKRRTAPSRVAARGSTDTSAAARRGAPVQGASVTAPVASAPPPALRRRVCRAWAETTARAPTRRLLHPRRSRSHVPLRERIRRLLWRAIVVSTLVGSGVLASPDAANEHYQRGVELAKAGQQEAARAEFEAALRLEPHPRVLYNLAKLALEMGDSAAAIQYLHRYLEMDTSASPPEQVAEVRAALRALEGENAETETADRAPTPAPAEPGGATPRAGSAPPEATPTNQPAEGPRKPTKERAPTRTAASQRSVPSPPPDEPSSHVATFALGGTGVALVAAGLGVWLWNDGTHRRISVDRAALVVPASPDSPDEVDPIFDYGYALGESDAQFRSVQAFDAVSWSLMGAGVVCLGVATWLYLTSEPKGSVPGKRAVAFGPDRLILRW